MAGRAYFFCNLVEAGNVGNSAEISVNVFAEPVSEAVFSVKHTFIDKIMFL